MSSWIRSERWSVIPEVTASNVYTISEDTNKKLVLVVIDIVERLNASSVDGRFFNMFNEAAELVRKDNNLHSTFQFGWTDGNSMANSVIMGEMSVPSNLKSSYSKTFLALQMRLSSTFQVTNSIYSTTPLNK